ncbi:MAG: hypothetical protein QOD72_2089 [Acidimicrobiaceae bacterium]|nr:hypothetical protein [Acidimicrobiaceae bacterium]
MSRRQRQLEELRGLCRSGSLLRAIDLTFEHFACFGRDDTIIEMLADAIEHMQAPKRARHRLAELRASQQ